MQNSLLESIGNTPLVRLNKIPLKEGISCQIYAKCEYMNPSGSIKDRIVLKMVEKAEKEGILIPGTSHLIEPTSGNTGISLAMVAGAIKGYPVTACMKQKNSIEKQITMEILGARVIKTPTHVPPDSPLNHIKTAYSLAESCTPKAIVLDQYSNEGNVEAHFQDTAQEIAQQCNYAVDAVFIGVGTGGSITGVAKRLKQLVPGVKIVAVEPSASAMMQGSSMNPAAGEYQVEGIGYDFIPSILQSELIDEWIPVTDKDSFVMARRLAAEEGFLCGGSSGSTAFAALQWAREKGWDSSKRIVVIFADSERNYLSKHVNEYWMLKNSYSDELLEKRANKNLKSTLSVSSLPIIPVINDNIEKARLLEAFFHSPLVQIEGSEAFLEQSCFLRNFLGNSNESSTKVSLKPSMYGLSVKELECTFMAELSDLHRLLVLFEYYSFGVVKDDSDHPGKPQGTKFRLLTRETFLQSLASYQ